LWQQLELAISRDYWLPLPDETLYSVVEKRAEYIDMAAMSRRLLGELGTPQFNAVDKTWQLDSTSPLLGLFGTELHTEQLERNSVNSHAAVLGFDKHHRDFIGRWQPDQNNDYLRTAREVVSQLQTAVVASLRMADKRISEEAAMDVMRAHLTQRWETEEVTHMMRCLEFRGYVDLAGSTRSQITEMRSPGIEGFGEEVQPGTGSWVYSLH